MENVFKNIRVGIDVLDKGFVELIDCMGDDQRIVDAARVSYTHGKTKSENKKLIKYLYDNKHTSPFEQVVFTFIIKMPIFVARQIVRHRTARLNEVSARYTELPEEFYVPDVLNINKQSTSNKQARGEVINEEDALYIADHIKNNSKKCFNEYKKLLDKGVARELARIVLPLNTYTQVMWQIDLHNLFHFLELRLHEHVQYETREYAKAIFELINNKVPIACELFFSSYQDMSSKDKQIFISGMQESKTSLRNLEKMWDQDKEFANTLVRDILTPEAEKQMGPINPEYDALEKKSFIPGVEDGKYAQVNMNIKEKQSPLKSKK